jgi:hypothetical protein
MTKVAGSLEEAWLEQCAVRTRHAKSGSAESQANLPVTTETKRGLWTVFHKDSQVSISIFRSSQLLNTVDETYENEGAFCLVSCFFSERTLRGLSVIGRRGLVSHDFLERASNLRGGRMEFASLQR